MLLCKKHLTGISLVSPLTLVGGGGGGGREGALTKSVHQLDVQDRPHLNFDGFS